MISLLADVLTFRKRQQPGRSTVLLVIIITARKRSLQRLCFYTCLSVILFTGEFCLSACWDGRAPRSRPPGSRHPLRSRHPPGPETPQEPESDTPSSRHPPPGADAPPAQSMLGYKSNNLAVRILLECILVFEDIGPFCRATSVFSIFIF